LLLPAEAAREIIEQRLLRPIPFAIEGCHLCAVEPVVGGRPALCLDERTEGGAPLGEGIVEIEGDGADHAERLL
jgi:hypothetical protein